jgi:hypothetical protein
MEIYLFYHRHKVLDPSNCCSIKNPVPNNGNLFTEPLPRNGRCLQSRRLAAGLYAIIFTEIQALWALEG